MVKMTMAPLTVEEERGMTGKFVAKQKREEKKRKKEEEGLAQLERETTGLLSTPEGGHMCINPHDPPEPASYLFRHNQVLGDMPPIVGLCEYCAQQLKLMPIEKTEIESSKIFKNLVSVANKLDAKGLYKEAEIIDILLKNK